MEKGRVLTEARIKSLKPSEKPKKVFDRHGLYLEVSPGGGKWWRLKYRFDGKEKRLSLGVYPKVKLKEAREQRDEMRNLLRRGLDPSLVRQKSRKTAISSQALRFERDYFRDPMVELSLQGKVDLSFLKQWTTPKENPAGLLDPLLQPLDEFVTRPGKHIRASLVYISFSIAAANRELSVRDRTILRHLASWVEWLHGGSLVIDDIQDRADFRRGRPALHSLMGQASAINAANWLYFWPTQRFRALQVPQGVELELYRIYHETMTLAHFGQSVDLGYDLCRVSREQAHSISMAAIGLKTGALMGMCAELGAVVAGADSRTRKTLLEFGREFGASLQMFNDVKDFTPESFQASVESGGVIRPSWVWATASRILEDDDFKTLQEGIARGAGECRLRDRVVAEARIGAESRMQANLKLLESRFKNDPAVTRVKELATKLMEAYR